MEHVYFQITVSRKQRKSLPSFQVQIQNPLNPWTLLRPEFKAIASCVLVSLIPG